MFLRSSHKILGHYGGRFHFAFVELEILSIVSKEPELSVILDSKEGIFDSWISASMMGVKKFMSEFPEYSHHKRFIVRKIFANLVDTEDQTVGLVSYLAIYKSLIENRDVPEIDYDGRWSVDSEPFDAI